MMNLLLIPGSFINDLNVHRHLPARMIYMESKTYQKECQLQSNSLTVNFIWQDGTYCLCGSGSFADTPESPE